MDWAPKHPFEFQGIVRSVREVCSRGHESALRFLFQVKHRERDGIFHAERYRRSAYHDLVRAVVFAQVKNDWTPNQFEVSNELSDARPDVVGGHDKIIKQWKRANWNYCCEA